MLGIVDKISMKYQALGLCVGLSLDKIEGFRQRSFLDNTATCNFILNAWVSKGGHPPNYPLSWQGLYDLLKDIGHKKAGGDMRRDLACKGIIINIEST